MNDRERESGDPPRDGGPGASHARPPLRLAWDRIARVGARRQVVGALDRVGLLDRLLWLRARLDLRQVAVLTYHRTGRVEDVGELDPGLIEATPSELAAQLDVLSARCTLVSLADFRRFTRGARLPPNPVLVTFDDGYADCHDVALPILKRYGVPATFFVSTAFPHGGKLFWWDRVWLTMRRSRCDRVELEYPARLSLAPASAPEEAARLVCRAIKRTQSVDLNRLWEELERKTLVSLDPNEERAIAARTLMSWAAIRKLRSAGMEVQSHSHAHIVLSTLTPEAAQRDLARSAQVLREAIDGDVYSVAYPVGYPLVGAHRRAPLDAGLELGFTNATGTCSMRRIDPLNVPRIAMGLDVGLPTYKTKLLFSRGTRLAQPAPEK